MFLMKGVADQSGVKAQESLLKLSMAAATTAMHACHDTDAPRNQLHFHYAVDQTHICVNTHLLLLRGACGSPPPQPAPAQNRFHVGNASRGERGHAACHKNANEPTRKGAKTPSKSHSRSFKIHSRFQRGWTKSNEVLRTHLYEVDVCAPKGRGCQVRCQQGLLLSRLDACQQPSDGLLVG